MVVDAQRRAFNVMLVEVGRDIPASQLPALFLLHDLCAAEREDCGNAVKLLTILLDRGDFSQHDTAGLKKVIQNAGMGALLHLVEEYDVQWLSGRAPVDGQVTGQERLVGQPAVNTDGGGGADEGTRLLRILQSQPARTWAILLPRSLRFDRLSEEELTSLLVPWAAGAVQPWNPCNDKKEWRNEVRGGLYIVDTKFRGGSLRYRARHSSPRDSPLVTPVCLLVHPQRQGTLMPCPYEVFDQQYPAQGLRPPQGLGVAEQLSWSLKS